HAAARRHGCCEAERAWVAGLLAPLGWLALCAVAPAAVEACLADYARDGDADQAQRVHWGRDHAALARRLARRWALPDWLAATVGHLGLPARQAAGFGADPVLLALMRVALRQARNLGFDLGLVGEMLRTEDEERLGISGGAREWFRPLAEA